MLKSPDNEHLEYPAKRVRKTVFSRSTTIDNSSGRVGAAGLQREYVVKELRSEHKEERLYV